MVGRWSIAAIGILIRKAIKTAWGAVSRWSALLVQHPHKAIVSLWIAFWESWSAVSVTAALLIAAGFVPQMIGYGTAKACFITANVLFFVRLSIEEKLHGKKESRKPLAERAIVTVLLLAFFIPLSLLACGMLANFERGNQPTAANIWEASLFWKSYTARISASPSVASTPESNESVGDNKPKEQPKRSESRSPIEETTEYPPSPRNPFVQTFNGGACQNGIPDITRQFTWEELTSEPHHTETQSDWGLRGLTAKCESNQLGSFATLDFPPRMRSLAGTQSFPPLINPPAAPVVAMRLWVRWHATAAGGAVKWVISKGCDPRTIDPKYHEIMVITDPVGESPLTIHTFAKVVQLGECKPLQRMHLLIARNGDEDTARTTAHLLDFTVEYKQLKRAAISEKPPTLLDLFKRDFPGTASFSDKGFDFKDSNGQVGAHVDWRLLMDFVSKTEFIAFYIPPVKDEVPVCLALIDTVHPIINGLSQHLDASGGPAGESTSLRDLTFSGRVFIYHEWPLSNKQKADIVEAYSAKGLDVQFRSMDYLATQVIAWHHEHDK